MDLGLIERPLKLMFNLTGVLVGMAHIFLPFMVLMLVPVLQAVPRDLRDAASHLAGGRAAAQLSVTLPLTAHGILAGPSWCSC